MIKKFAALAAASLALAAASGALAQPACKLTLTAEIKVKVDGLRVYVPAKINGKETTFVVDSGAFFSTLDSDSATRLALKKGSVPEGFQLAGVGGTADTWLGTAESFEIARNLFHGVEFLIVGQSIDDDASGLIGQNVLNAADIEYDLAHGVIRLFKTADCRDRMLAYWSEQEGAGSIVISPMSLMEPHIMGFAKVNGKHMHALFDTGAPYSELTMQAAKRVGFKHDAPGVTPGGVVGGIGRGRSQTWIAPFESFSLGDEMVKNTKLRVADHELSEDIDMLIGADFFLSHRIYVARSQRKLYFTYNGGPVFRLESTEGGAANPEPVDAAGYSRRASAQAERGKIDAAIKDFSRAVDLQPTEPLHRYDRALAYVRADKADLALVDLDQALKLKPDHVKALTARGGLHLKRKEADLARADFEAAIKAAGDEDDVRMEIARTYADALAFDEALGQMDAWITAHPTSVNYADALNSRCWTRALANKDLDKALVDCNLALKAGGRDAAVLDSRGLVYLRMGDLDHSIGDYNAAIRQMPKSAWSLYGRGLAKQRKGMTAEGKADIAAAVAAQADIAEEIGRYGLKE